MKRVAILVARRPKSLQDTEGQSDGWRRNSPRKRVSLTALQVRSLYLPLEQTWWGRMRWQTCQTLRKQPRVKSGSLLVRRLLSPFPAHAGVTTGLGQVWTAGNIYPDGWNW